MLDDSFEHEVWNDTPHARVLLLVDLWHPDVAAVEREEIRQMFGEARAERLAVGGTVVACGCCYYDYYELINPQIGQRVFARMSRVKKRIRK